MQLIDRPQQLDRKSYDDTRESFLRKHVGIPGIRAILEFGTIGLPGVSDMDFFIIVEPDTPVILSHFRNFSEEERYVLGSRQCVLSANTYPFLRYYDPWLIAVQPVFDPSGGYACLPDALDPEASKELSLNFIYQKTTYGCLPFLAKIMAHEILPARHFFEEIKLFKYFLREFRKLNTEPPPDSGLPLYANIEREWFDLTADQQEKRMIALLPYYRESILRTYRTLLIALSSGYSMQPLPKPLPPTTASQRALLKKYPQSFVVDLGGSVFVYQMGRKNVRVEHQSIVMHFLPNIDRTVFVLPLELIQYPAWHLFLHGPISDGYTHATCTDLSSVPLRIHPAMKTLHTVSNRNLLQTCKVMNNKYYEITYGFRCQSIAQPSLRSLVAQIRSILQKGISTLITRIRPSIRKTYILLNENL